MDEATKEEILSILSTVKDPEVPVVDVVGLGIIRDITFLNGSVTVFITPTYSGCPAMEVIESDVQKALHKNGYESVIIKRSLDPAWTTDWMSEEAKEALRVYGIAPPDKLEEEPLVPLRGSKAKKVACPLCGSATTTRTSEFGSTACKALYRCTSCEQPFEKFKEL